MRISLVQQLTLVAALAVAAVATPVHGASAPTVTITSPTSGDTIYGTFPLPLPLTFQVVHGDQGNLASIKDLTVTAQKAGDADATTILSVDKPFEGKQCPVPLAAGITACGVSADETTGTLTVNWQVPSAGSYTFVVTTTHGNADGSDEITVVFDLQTVSVEYPAPPAIANAYINSLSAALKKQFTAGVRGCVISAIAQNHGQLEAYNPKPGPYNVAKVQADVKIYSQGCGGPIF